MPDAMNFEQFTGPQGGGSGPSPGPGWQPFHDEQGNQTGWTDGKGGWRFPSSGNAPTNEAPMSFDEFAKPSGSENPGKLSGPVANFAAGGNSLAAGALGAPVDAASWAINKGIGGINSLAGTNIPQATEPVGGSDWWKSTMGLAGADPRNVEPADDVDQLARAGGAGMMSMVLPYAGARAIPQALTAAPGVVNGIVNTLRHGSLSSNAMTGTTAGVGGQYAEDQVADNYKPLANFGGQMLGGGLASMSVAGVKALLDSGWDLAKNWFAPMGIGAKQSVGTGANGEPVIATAGQQRVAGQRLMASSSNPSELRGRLDDATAAPPLVPGSQPTTFQAVGDQGLGQLERTAATNNPDMYLARRADQNAARVGALDTLAPEGSHAATVGDFLTRQLAEIDARNDQLVQGAQGNASAALSKVGGNRNANEYGSAVRTELADAKGAAKANEGRLWDAIDPDAKLAIDVSPVTKAANDIPGSMSRSAKPMEGEEKAIFDVAESYPGVIPFRELGDLRGRVLAQIREIRPKGDSVELRRLGMLRQSIDDAMASGAGQKAEALTPNAPTPDAPNMLSQLQAAPWAKNVPPDQLRQMASEYEARTAAGGGGVNAPSAGGSVFTPSGRQIGVRYEVADLSSPDAPISSHTHEMKPNPDYPAEMQPRDRTRPVSGAQIAEMSGNLQPERLGYSASATEGAPIIGPDNVVESGNARLLAIAKAYRENSPQADAYRAWLRAQGIDTEGKGYPVLVRRRLTDLSPEERVKFTQEANAAPGLAMSSTERAAQDATRLSDNVLGLYRGGDIGSAANAAFVRAFVQSVPEKGEVGALATPGRTLSVEGKARIGAALLQKAYGNSALVRALTETNDENVRALGGVLAWLIHDGSDFGLAGVA
jgi:hypothetical protein